MRILLLYRYEPAYTYDDWLHIRFAWSIAKTHGIELFAYGPRLHEDVHPELVPMQFHPDITMENLGKGLRPDVILMMTKARMFYHYYPAGIYPKLQHKNRCWLPKDFQQCQLPKVMLEEDYHYEQNDLWYIDMGIDLVLQRHHGSHARGKNVRMEWFPFSVDTEVFTAVDKPRCKKICFAGTLGPAYPYRDAAINAMAQHDILVTYSNQDPKMRRRGQDYVDCMREFVCHLCGTSKYHITPAKIFEIMSSGSLLLINDELFMEDLFDEHCYFTFDPDNIGEVVTLAKNILNYDPAQQQHMIHTARQQIEQKHSHQVRIQELIQYFKELGVDVSDTVVGAGS
jgi:hypothetical protein